MAVDKNFVVRNGLEVSTDLIYAESVEGKVGIGTTTLEAKLTVQGDLRVEDLEVSGITTSRDLISTNLNVTGVSTFNDIEVNGVTGLTTVSASSSITALTYFGDGSNLDGLDESFTPPGKVYYVTTNGNDANSGENEFAGKATIKSALASAVSGDTVKVLPGTYIEDNPLTLEPDVSIEGAELRSCIVVPQNKNEDLFLVSNANHITDLSFQGQEPTVDPAPAVVAYKPLVGVASDRFFDAARIIRTNLDFIATEAVGYLTSTDYKIPAFQVSNISGIATDARNCSDDIKDILLAICHDITRGGNSKCVGAGLSYYNSGGTLLHITGSDPNGYSIREATIEGITKAAEIARSCINNVTWNGGYQSEFYQVKDLSIQNDPTTGSNSDINSCSNVLSAVTTCAGIVTSIVGLGTDAVTISYPGNAGAGQTDPNAIPSQGVGIIRKGPYIRNCTNFIPGSVGMRADGFHAEPGDKLDNGVQGSMNVDSYTQINQGGIGVEVTNGAYCQLVSIFTICDDQAIVTKNGGQCDLTNSNSSFGTFGLVSDGVGDAGSKSIFRYTGQVNTTQQELETTIEVSGVGSYRPYTGQTVFFGELYYEVESFTVTNGGSGYTEAPSVTITTPTGPSAIPAEAFTTVENGAVTEVNLIGNGRNFRLSDAPTISFSGGGGSSAAATVNLRPLYYKVTGGSLPSAGISTVNLATALLNDVSAGTTAYFSRQSLQIVSSHSFEFIGAGNTLENAKPSKGGVTNRDNEIVKLNGGQIVFTSTDQDGNFAIGEDLLINQSTGSITGRAFDQSILNTVTPLIIALG